MLHRCDITRNSEPDGVKAKTKTSEIIKGQTMKTKKFDCIHRCCDGVNCPYCSAFDRLIEDERTCTEFCCEYSNEENEEVAA